MGSMSQERGITPRADDFSQWYNDVIMRAELADYSPVRGCMVIRPRGYGIWELMQRPAFYMTAAALTITPIIMYIWMRRRTWI